MSWEKLPFCGGLAAVLLTIAFIRAVFMVPDFDFWFWDVFFYIFLAALDVSLMGYIGAVWWKRLCIGIIVFSLTVLAVMQFYPQQAETFLQSLFAAAE